MLSTSYILGLVVNIGDITMKRQNSCPHGPYIKRIMSITMEVLGVPSFGNNNEAKSYCEIFLKVALEISMHSAGMSSIWSTLTCHTDEPSQAKCSRENSFS